MPPPLPRCSGWAHSSLKLAHPYQPSPKPLSGRPAHRPFRGLLGVHSRCGLHTRAVTKIVTVIRRLQTFRRLHACSGCFRLERSPGGPCTHWKSAALSRRTREAGRCLTSLANAYSVEHAIISGPETDLDAGFAAILSEILSERPRWDDLGLTELDPLDPSYRTAVRSLRRAGLLVECAFASGTWYE